MSCVCTICSATNMHMYCASIIQNKQGHKWNLKWANINPQQLQLSIDNPDYSEFLLPCCWDTQFVMPKYNVIKLENKPVRHAVS